MAGTILKTDLQSSIEDQLREYAKNLGNVGQQAQQTVGDTFEDLQRAGRTGLQDVQAQLSDYATNAYNAAQQQLQEQAAQKAQQAAQVQQQLSDYATKVSQPPQQDQGIAGAVPQQQAGGPAALLHSEEPATATDQVGGGPALGSKWKTQFDFGATYTGDYRTGTPHRGVDLVPSNGQGIGTEVDAFTPGTVTNIFRDPGGAGGLIVYVQDADGLTHAYMHLAGTAPGLAVGQQVRRGQAIAQMGESGTEGSPHLHYEVRKNAASGDPLNQLIDPRPYLAGSKQPGGGGPVQAVQQAVGGAQQAVQSVVQGGLDAASDRVHGQIDAIRAAASKTGVPQAVIAGIMDTEAAGPTSRSSADALGFMQVLRTWFKPGEDPFDPITNIQRGAEILRDNYARYGSWDKAAAAYFGAIDSRGNITDASDSGGTTGGSYVSQFTRNMGRYADMGLDTAGGAVSAAANAIPGVAGARRIAGDVLQAGTDQVAGARAPIYGTNQPAGSPMDQLTAIQNQLDTLRTQIAGAPEAARRQLEPYNQPPLAGAPEAVGQTLGGAFNELGTRSRQLADETVAGAQQLGRQIGPNLGFDDAELQRRRAATAAQSQPAVTLPPSLDFRPLPPEQVGPGEYLGAAAGALFGQPFGQVQSQAQKQAGVTSAQRGFAEVSPTTTWGPDVTLPGGTEPTHIGGMLVQGLVDQIIQNPLIFLPGAPMGEALNTFGGGIVQDFLPQLGPRAAQLTAAAINGAVQNALFEVGQPDATPQSIGEQFLAGAGFGTALHGVTGLAGAIGRRVLERAPDLETLLRSRQPAQAQIGFAAGVPARTPTDVLHGMAVPRAGYEPGTPEHTVETFLQDRARAQGKAQPDITAADIGGLPGMAGSRMRGLQEVRDAVDAGLPAARWYQEIVQQVRQDTGQDINPREAAVLMGAFGGNAGVAPNYHAMLSVFDAMRQAKPDLSGFERMDEPQIQATQAFKDVAALVHGDKSYADDSMLARVMRGYRTGEIPVPSGAKLSSYTQDFLHALNELYSPYSTQDVHQGRLFGARPDIQGGNGLPNVSQSDAAYRTMHALTNWVARERNLPPDQAQAAGWTVFRTLWNDPTIGPELRNDRIGLSDAIKQGQQSGVLNPQTLATGGLAEVTAPRTNVPTSWVSKINDVRDRIRQNGSYNAPPPESATAVSEMALYHPSIQSAAQQRANLDPSGFQYGTVSGPKVGIRRPVGNEPAGSLRDLVLGDQPVLRVPGDVQVDPRTGKIPWLLPEHEVQRTSGGTYVTVAGVGDDAAHLIGRRLGADRFNHAEPAAKTAGGLNVDGITSRAEQAQIVDALQARGLPVLREQAGVNLRVPLVEGRATTLLNQVQDALREVGSSGTLTSYRGASHVVESAAAGRTSRTGGARYSGGAAGSLGVQAGDSLLGHPLAASVFRDAVPAGSGVRGGRQRGEVSVPFATNLVSGAFGGYAGNLATPANASPEERARNIAAGAATGFAAGHLITRLPLRGAPEAIGGAREPFRAPGRGETPELRATTQEPPGGPTGPTGREPRTLGEVRSNRYALREAASGETPMTTDEMLSYGDTLEQRLTDVQARRDAVDEMLRNPSQKVERPPWAAGLTNLQVAEVARRADISPYEPLWWEKAGLEQGSGEVRAALREGGTFTEAQQQRDLTPAELRRERTSLDQEAQHITAAYDQMQNAPAEPNLVRVRPDAEAGRSAGETLPFDTGAPAEPGAVPVTEAGGGLDEGARLAQEIVLAKGRGTLRSDTGTVSLEGDVRSTALVSHEAVQGATETPPSARTAANMPNLDAMLEGEPEIAAQIRKAAEDNPDLMEAYRQGRISMDSLRNDLAKRVGMTVQDWIKTPIGKAFNPEEMVALQAAAVEQQGRMQDLARSIVAKGGVQDLTPEELVFSAATLADATKILAVARGGRTTAGRTLNALKQRFDRTMASGITLANEQLAARRLAQQARRAATRATTVLAKGRALEREATTAKAEAARSGAPRNIVDQIAQAYDQLDRYNAMTLHEKGAEFDRLKQERADRAAARKERVRGAPEELLSALRDELKAEQDNFAKRKDTWETMAFWDTKGFENAMSKRNAFRGQLYIEQQRKVANIAAKDAEKTAARSFDAKLEEGQRQRAKAEKLLQEIGGRDVTKDILQQFVTAMNDPSPEAAAKFMKGMAKQSNWGRANIIRIAGLVSGPLTNMVNLGGNAGNAMIEVPTRALVVGIDALRAAVTGGERQAYKAELLPMLQAYGPGAVGAVPNIVRVLKTGINPAEAADLSKLKAGFASGSGKVDAAVEMPLRLLSAEDILFRSMATSAHAMRVATREAEREGYRGASRKGRAANIIANLEEYPELAKEVSDEAARMIFQEKRALPIPGGSLPGGTKPVQEAGRLAVSQVAPFIKTPTNITAQGIALSPVGFGGALEAARGVRDMPTGTRTERYARGRQVLLAEERAARAVIGTGILAAGVGLGMAGMLTAAYPEDDQARSALPQGWRPWSLKVSDPVSKNTYYVPLQNFSAAGVPLAIAAIATDPVHSGKTILSSEEWGLAAMGLGKYVLDSTFLQGMSDFVDALQDPRARGSKFGESLVSSYGPYSGLNREMQRMAGVASRNPHEGAMGLVEAMEANYPGLSGNVPPSRTPLGDERTQAATGASRLLPARFDIERDEPTLQVLRKTGVGIPKPPKAIGFRGGSIELTEDERAQLQQMRGQAIRDIVPRVKETSESVQKAVDLATASATRAFLAQLGGDEVRTRWTAKQPPEPYYLGTAAD